METPLKHRPDESSVVDVAGVAIGGRELVVIAGPCAVESRDQILEIAVGVKNAGASCLRGGAFKPRTSPYSFQGFGRAGLELLAEAREFTGLPVVTELLDARDAEDFYGVADMIQIGARNMNNTSLLREAAQMRLPILLKRNAGATVRDVLDAADYILAEGNEQIVLCERGIRTFEDATRYTLDVSAVPLLKARTHLPVIVDPSHAAGDAELVAPLALAAVAAGADGLLVEVHNAPDAALSDGKQSLDLARFPAFMEAVEAVAGAVGLQLHARTLAAL